MAGSTRKKMTAEQVAEREKQRTAAIRMQLAASHPFWGYLLVEAELIPAAGLPALAATDCVRRIWYNPALTQYLTMSELGFVMAHELGHIVLQSLERRRGRVLSVWNSASDFAVNRIVAGIRDRDDCRPLYTPPVKFLPVVGRIAPLMDDAFDGMTAEAIYEALRENPMWDAAPCLVEVALPSGDGQGRTFQVDRRPGAWDIHVPRALADGAGAGGKTSIDTEGSLASDTPAPDIPAMVARALAYAQECDEPGDIPGDLLRRIGRRQSSRDEAWRTVFRRIAGRCMARDEYSRARPNRRWLDMGFIVPGLNNDGGPSVVVAVDTSASMTGDRLTEVCAEIRPVLARAAEAVLVVHDAGIQEVIMDAGAIMDWLLAGWTRGGGGTDHRPVFDWIARSHLQPDLFVGLTDCASTYPVLPPPFPVVWVTPAGGIGERPPWGDYICVGQGPASSLFPKFENAAEIMPRFLPESDLNRMLVVSGSGLFPTTTNIKSGGYV
ncbi:MAG TPA: VWA-like domain-containing protein [Myxococcota bacterium]|nr:VWA-like domain-containing protein [Myxococcota bacterium]